jgi:hypothetical protein
VKYAAVRPASIALNGEWCRVNRRTAVKNKAMHFFDERPLPVRKRTFAMPGQVTE